MIDVIARLLIVAFTFLTLAEAQGRVVPQRDRTAMIKGMNEERREEAKKSNISNMHKLSWDDGFAETAVKLSCDWPPSYSGPGRVMVFFGTLSKSQQRELEKNPYDAEPAWRSIEVSHHPVQTKIGCSFMVCDIPTPKGKIKSAGWCVMGPESTPPKGHIERGPAGSGCGSLGDDDGLCLGSGGGSGRSSPGGSGSRSLGSTEPEGKPEAASSDSKKETTTESAASLPSIALPLITIFSVQLGF